MAYGSSSSKLTEPTIPGGISKDSPVLSGVPQCTILGPLLFLIMISDINKGTTSSKLVSFAVDTRVYSNIAEQMIVITQYDLNSIYNWAVFNSEKFHYISFSSSLSSNSDNVYANPNMEIINLSDNVLILAYLCLVTVLLSSTSKTYVKNVQTCLVGS